MKMDSGKILAVDDLVKYYGTGEVWGGVRYLLNHG